MTFVAQRQRCRLHRGRAVFVDVLDADGNLDPDLLDEAIVDQKRQRATRRRRDGGRPARSVCRLRRRRAVCARHRGAADRGRRRVAGRGIRRPASPQARSGRVAALSFNGNKIMTTSGGGMLLSDDRRPRRPRAVPEHPGAGARAALRAPAHRLQLPDVSNVLAALGRAQLARLDAMIARRARIRATLRRGGRRRCRASTSSSATATPRTTAGSPRWSSIPTSRGVTAATLLRRSTARTSRPGRCGSRCTCSRCSPTTRRTSNGASERLSSGRHACRADRCTATTRSPACATALRRHRGDRRMTNRGGHHRRARVPGLAPRVPAPGPPWHRGRPARPRPSSPTRSAERTLGGVRHGLSTSPASTAPTPTRRSSRATSTLAEALADALRARPAGPRRLRQLDPGRRTTTPTAAGKRGAAEILAAATATSAARSPTSCCRTCSASTAGRRTTRSSRPSPTRWRTAGRPRSARTARCRCCTRRRAAACAHRGRPAPRTTVGAPPGGHAAWRRPRCSTCSRSFHASTRARRDPGPDRRRSRWTSSTPTGPSCSPTRSRSSRAVHARRAGRAVRDRARARRHRAGVRLDDRARGHPRRPLPPAQGRAVLRGQGRGGDLAAPAAARRGGDLPAQRRPAGVRGHADDVGAQHHERRRRRAGHHLLGRPAARSRTTPTSTPSTWRWPRREGDDDRRHPAGDHPALAG